MKFTTKKHLVLKELFDLGINEKHYNLSKLQVINVYSISDHEIFEIADWLENEGYVHLLKSKTEISAAITGKGVEYMEDRLKAEEKFSSDFTDREKSIVQDVLDDILTRLEKMDKGQQITYDDLLSEINDLKELLTKLNKKNWMEVFKGKMVNIGLGQLTEKGIEFLGSFEEIQNLLKSSYITFIRTIQN